MSEKKRGAFMGRTLSDNRAERRKMMLEDSVYKVIPIIAVPMMISMLIDSAYNIADTYFVSQLGKTATGAVGINDSMLHFIRSVAMGFGMGASSGIGKAFSRSPPASGRSFHAGDHISLSSLTTGQPKLT